MSKLIIKHSEDEEYVEIYIDEKYIDSINNEEYGYSSIEKILSVAKEIAKSMNMEIEEITD